jgi:hypothetical protein
MTPEQEKAELAKLKPGEWMLIKACECKGPSKPFHTALLPVCKLCGTPWKILGRFPDKKSPEIRRVK